MNTATIQIVWHNTKDDSKVVLFAIYKQGQGGGNLSIHRETKDGTKTMEGLNLFNIIDLVTKTERAIELVDQIGTDVL
jgi:hypothetical protein